jgi:peptide/nickel transport system permease protein
MLRAVRRDKWTLTCAIIVFLILFMAVGADLLTSIEGQGLNPDIKNLGPTGLPAEGRVGSTGSGLSR